MIYDYNFAMYFFLWVKISFCCVWMEFDATNLVYFPDLLCVQYDEFKQFC